MLNKGENVYIENGDFRDNFGRVVAVVYFSRMVINIKIVRSYIVNVYDKERGKILAEIAPKNLTRYKRLTIFHK